MNLSILGIPAALAVVTASASAQDGMLRAWMDAPETIIAGETVSVSAWVTLESSIINMDEAFFSEIATSINVSQGESMIDSFSSSHGQFVRVAGTPTTTGINDIWSWQPGPWEFAGSVDTAPVIAAFSFELTTLNDARGLIQLDFAGTTWRPESPYLAWNLDLDHSVRVDVDMPNIEGIFESTTIRVIPPPGTSALLMFVGLGAMRRQRQ